jgi:lysophospholipase L1-like esterase
MSISRCILLALCSVWASLLAVSADAVDTSLAVKPGEVIAFMGDSITAGAGKPDHYATLVMEALNHEGLKVTHIAAGVSGNRSKDMLARLDKDVLNAKPQWMTLSCGVNDVWHFELKLGNRTFEGIPLDQYQKNIREILEKAHSAGVKVMILTATMIGEDPERDLNKKLIPYNDFLREIAKEKGLLLADLSKDMHELLKKMPDEPGKAKMFGEPNYERNIKNKLTGDGCHMNKLGNIMMAKGVLRSFGLSEAKITAAESRWTTK